MRIGWPGLSVLFGAAFYLVSIGVFAVGVLHRAPEVTFGFLGLPFLALAAVVTGHIGRRLSANHRRTAAGGLLLGYLGLFLTLIAVALPACVLGTRVVANEAAAVASVRVLHDAEQAWKEGLHAPFTCDLQSLSQKGLIDELLARGERSGYLFSLRDCSASSFVVVALPDKTVRQGGVRSFCTDQSGTLKMSRDGTADGCLKNGEILQ